MNKQKFAKLIIWFLSLSAVTVLLLMEPISQDLSYHSFVDNNTILSIPNFWNVVSNIPFLIVGILALYKLNQLELIPEMGLAYWLLFFAVALVAFGSGYYHLNPSNQTLVWDRLPMTIAFMSLFAIIIAEFVNIRSGSLLLIPMIVFGVFSVLYWQWTESSGAGDLRLYALVQFLPILIIPLILLMYPSRFSHVSGYWWLLTAYVLAKVLEYYDVQIYNLTAQFISGHAIKHVVAAIGMYVLFVSYKRRKRV